MVRARQKYDYKALPVATAAASSTFTEEELREDALLRDILEGRVSLESRLEGLPKFQYDFDSLRSRPNYESATIEELREIWYEGRREVEVEVEPGLLSMIRESFNDFLSRVLFDTEEEKVVFEDKPLEEKIEEGVKELKKRRREDKKWMGQMQQAKQSLRSYVHHLESRYQQDNRTYPRLTRFAKKLRSEIGSLEDEIEKGDLSMSEEESYSTQVERGQEYFARLVNQIRYMESEIGLVEKTKSRFSKMLMRMNSLIDGKEAAVREALLKIKKAEMTKDLGVIVDAANYFTKMEDDISEIDELQEEAYELLDATFDAVDRALERNSVDEVLEEGDNAYRDDLYRKKSEELDQLLGNGSPIF